MTRRPMFRRVVIALGTSREGLAALGTWADLAVRLGADLSGLFVEDVDWLRMAGFPSACVVGGGSVARSVDAAMMERVLRRTASEARVALEAAAQQRTIACSFKSVRGSVATETVAAVQSGDLVVLERVTLGSSAPDVLAQCPVSVLCLRAGTAGGRTVFALVDPGRSERHVLELAAELAAAARRDLLMLVLGDEAVAVRAAEAATGARAASGVRLRVRAVAGDRERLLDVLRRERGGILVSSPATLATVDEVGAASLDVERWSCSLLLVRTPTD